MTLELKFKDGKIIVFEQFKIFQLPTKEIPYYKVVYNSRYEGKEFIEGGIRYVNADEVREVELK